MYHLTMPRAEPLEDRVPRYIGAEDENGCWPWLGSITTAGYGQIREHRSRKNIPAHRAVYELRVGLIPAGLDLDHLCRNRACVNPAHLEPVSRRTNVLRGASPSAHRARLTHCPAGHPYDEQNTYVWHGMRHCRVCRRDRERERWRRAHGFYQ